MPGNKKFKHGAHLTKLNVVHPKRRHDDSDDGNDDDFELEGDPSSSESEGASL
jgi:hypothetical protein